MINNVYNAIVANTVNKIIRKKERYEITKVDMANAHQVVDTIPQGKSLLFQRANLSNLINH